MLEIQRKINQLGRKIAIVMLAALVWVISLPANSVHAEGYFAEKERKTESSKPYYSAKDRRIERTDPDRPYYANKERLRNRTTARDSIDDRRRVDAKDYDRTGAERDLGRDRSVRRD
jgi:hypothetical protein